jgi:AcrR family transcriptional regulator
VILDDGKPFRSLSRDMRRERIVWAAKSVFMDKGLDEASMEDVAAAAGTTKPTVYAHFNSKDELFAAVLALVKGLFLGMLGSPEAYADEPLEAVVCYCGRYAELICMRDAIGYQRLIIAVAARRPTLGMAAYDALFAEAARSLASYLRDRRLTPHPERDAELLMWATGAGPMCRHLFGVEEAPEGLPGDGPIGTRVDLARVRDAVGVIAASWPA